MRTTAQKIASWLLIGLVVFGLLLGAVGLFLRSPQFAGIGDALFLAGVLTPIVVLKKVSLKEALFVGFWLAVTILLTAEGVVGAYALAVAVPLLVFSVMLVHMAGVELVGSPSRN